MTGGDDICPKCGVALVPQREAWRLWVMCVAVGPGLLGGMFVLLAAGAMAGRGAAPAAGPGPWFVVFRLAELAAALALPATWLALGGLRLLLVRRPTCPVCRFRPGLPPRETRITARLRKLLRWVLYYAGIPGVVLFVTGLAAIELRTLALGFLLAGEAFAAWLLLCLVPPARISWPSAGMRKEI